MKKHYLRLLSTCFSLLFASSVMFAQERTIKGKVTDAVGEPLPMANVVVRGTTTGTTTNMGGKFTLNIGEEADSLEFSYVGFGTKVLPIGNKEFFTVSLSEAGDLDEVVVTALGVKRSEEAMGYSIQSIDSREVSEVKTTNISNKLAGRVSGVYVQDSPNGPTGSTNVTIRGQTSLTGNSQPLYVVNGMPITNGIFSPGDGLNGSTTIDFGNASQVVNPDDVESISVLKGPAAAALYGSRAANGVILITTKTGEVADGWNVELNSTTMFQSILKKPNFQNEYGAGGDGKYSYYNGSTYTSATIDGTEYDFYDAFGENWGPRTNGQLIKQFNTDGEPAPFTPAPDNYTNFFQTGITNTNNISLNTNTEKGDVRLSLTNLNNRGMVPNTGLSRNTLYSSLGRDLFGDRLHIRANTFFIRSSSDNIPNAGYDESSSVMYGWLWYPRQVPVEDLEQYWRPGREGEQQRYVEELWVNNPYLVAEENTNSFQENRMIGNLMTEYDFTERLSARVRFGADFKDEQRQFRRATSTKGLPGQYGSYREDELSFLETNTELLISYDTDPYDGSKFDMDLKVGGNIMRQESKILTADNPQLLLPGEFTLTNNRTNVQVESNLAEKGINSVFALASFSYDGWVYLDLTGRNDWSSTLPSDNNSYFYPSASLSAVISDQLDLSNQSPLAFWKVRMAFAQVGSDTRPYQLTSTYRAQPLFGSTPAFTNNLFATNPNLKPERTTSYEVGTDVRFFDGSIGLDVTYYNMLSEDQIIPLPVATSSGRQERLVNAGAIRNTGVEVSLFTEPVSGDDFTWQSIVNLGHNRAIVEELPDSQEESYPIIADVFPGDEGSANLEYVAVEGEPLGQLRGLGFQRGPNGEIIHEDGLPLLTEEKVNDGTYQPDVRLGWQNNFSYKNFTLSILIDGQIGGQIYSRSHALYNTGGTITNEDDPNLDLTTLEGRPIYDVTYNEDGFPEWDLVDEGGLVAPGLMYNDQGDLVQNTDTVNPRAYFYAYYGNGFNRDNIEAATYDATFFKLREVRIAYQFPTSMFNQDRGIKGLTVALVGRNLALVSAVPTIDPEAYSIRNGLFVNGFESMSLPTARSYGVSVSMQL